MNELLALGVFAVTYLLLAFQNVPRLRVDRPSGALTGAVLMVAVGVLTPEEALAAVDLHILAFLLGMMVLVEYLREAGFFAWSADRLLHHAGTPVGLLAITVAASGLLSALFVNDTICLLFTPVVIAVTRRVALPPVPYLIALAAGSNIGSVLTIVGNPQNMLVGQYGRLDFLRFTATMCVPALFGLAACVAIVAWTYRAELRPEHASFRPRTGGATPVLDRVLAARTALLAAGVFVAFAAGVPYGAAAMAGATAIMLVGRTEPSRVLSSVDWPLLLLFAGLLVVNAGLEVSGAAATLLAPWHAALDQGPLVQLGAFAGSVLALSNLVSNVPAVMLVGSALKAGVPGETPATTLWYVLALASTFAGNLTLLGSVANLIVAGIARREGIFLGFVAYLRVGVPLTVVTTAFGVAWLWFVR